MKPLIAAACALFLTMPAPTATQPQALRQDGRLVDAITGAAVTDGIVTVNGHEIRADGNGIFSNRASSGQILARAPGYLRTDVAASALVQSGGMIRLTPFSPHALYLTVYGVGSRRLMRGVTSIIDAGGANALVIDLKGDRGLVSYPSAVPLATTSGARKLTTIRNLAAFVQRLHASGVYVIGRIVVFKDDPVARARPDLAIRNGGELFRDREGLAWTDPFQAEVRAYNIDLAVEAAKAGMDEIQFDYLRFPDSSARLTLAEPSTQASRVAAIADFLAEARRRLVPYNVFTAADIFGYVCWNTDDTGIGQKLEAIAPNVDYLSPMLYPSGFRWGIPCVRDPVANSYTIIHDSLAQAQRRLGISPKRFRPWLQSFKDYAFDRRPFDADEVADQIRAANNFGADGWMLWNARNTYSSAGLVPEGRRR